MGIRFFNNFTKITGWPAQFLCFRTKICYEAPEVQKRRIKGPAIIISNHTSVFDYAVYLFVFFGRTLRFQMAELLFEKKPLGTLIRLLGGIRVDRNIHDMGAVLQSEKILRRGGVVGIFPEGRLPRAGETPPIAFASGAAFLALSTNVPIIPVYTNGCYFQKKRARVMIGRPVYVHDLLDPEKSDRENLEKITQSLRTHIIELGKKLNEIVG